MKFKKDRTLWLRRLYEAKKRFGLIILNNVLIDDALKNERLERDSKWSESIAVGRKSFVEEVHKSLGFRAKTRKVEQVEESYLIREPVDSYRTLFGGKNVPLSAENTYLWDLTL